MENFHTTDADISERPAQALQYYELFVPTDIPNSENEKIVWLKYDNGLAVNEDINIDEVAEQNDSNNDILSTEISENTQLIGDQISFANLEPVTLSDGSVAYLAVGSEDPYTQVKLANGQYGLIQLKVLQSLISSPSSCLYEDSEINDETAKNDDEERLKTRKPRTYFQCLFKDCGKWYTTIHHLKVHERSHTGERPFKCEHPGCDKTFATTYSLKTHIRVHTGEKPYKCDVCDKSFKTSGDLQKHNRIHTGERPFSCSFEGCTQSFTTSNIRKVHMRTHTGERPYKCHLDDCAKTFVSATNYKNHMRIHTGEKPYVCKELGCTKRFTEYSSLYKHQLVHKDQKNKICSQCSKSYRQASTLLHHMKIAHGLLSNNSNEITSATNTELEENSRILNETNDNKNDPLVTVTDSSSSILSNNTNIIFDNSADSNTILDQNTIVNTNENNDEIFITDMSGNPVILGKFFKPSFQ